MSKVKYNIIKGDNEDSGVLGTEGRDKMIGLGGEDHFAAGLGNDLLLGGHGPDVLDGGPDDDRIIGGQGNDYIIGEDGRDTLEGDAGYNQFAYNHVTESGPKFEDRDIILDFTVETDRLTFTQLELGDGIGGYEFIGKDHFDSAGQVRYAAAKDGGINVFVNTDNDLKHEMSIHLNGVHHLDIDNFYF